MEYLDIGEESDAGVTVTLTECASLLCVSAD